jgi:hypothetical protein
MFALIHPQPAPNRPISPFLNLPGELRNLIYSYAIYPRLETIPISPKTKTTHFGKTILNPSIFRVSQQVRSEALSFLCVNKKLRFGSLDVATAFLNYIGPVIAEIKHLAIAQAFSNNWPLTEQEISHFFVVLERVTALQSVLLELWPPKRLHVGCEDKGRDEQMLRKKMVEYLMERGDVKTGCMQTPYWSRMLVEGSIRRAGSEEVGKVIDVEWEEMQKKGITQF